MTQPFSSFSWYFPAKETETFLAQDMQCDFPGFQYFLSSRLVDPLQGPLHKILWPTTPW